MNAWLAEYGLNATVISPGGDWLAIQVPVGKANEMLNADFSVFTHDVSGARNIRTLQYSIPEHLVNHLQLVHPTITFVPPVSPKPLQQAPAVETSAAQGKPPSACADFVDPACLQELYGIPTTAAAHADLLVVTGYNDERPSPTDMSVGDYPYYSWCRIPIRRSGRTSFLNFDQTSTLQRLGRLLSLTVAHTIPITLITKQCVQKGEVRIVKLTPSRCRTWMCSTPWDLQQASQSTSSLSGRNGPTMRGASWIPPTTSCPLSAVLMS